MTRIPYPLAGGPLHPQYRPDIDGLRAIAVLAVVGFHAFPHWVRGGFIGVDVFFVISGYLISTIIISGLEQGEFSFSEFYIRRIRRIFPALVILFAGCLVFGWFALLADEYQQLGLHIAGGAGFVSNFILWEEKGYFDNLAQTKPLLHLWSLGIEEQFYIFWPFLLWYCWKKRFNFLTAAALIAFVSFSINIATYRSDAVAAFYSPLSRLWELLAGAMLACISPKNHDLLPALKTRLDSLLRRIVRKSAFHLDIKILADTISAAGVLLIALSFVIISQERHFPGFWAMVPVLGATLIIFAGKDTLPNRFILSNRILVWFGLISYPLYLWHWPLLSFAHIIESGVPSRSTRIGAVLLSILLAWLTYCMVEKPLRFGAHARKKALILAAMMMVAGSAGYTIYKNNGMLARLSEFSAHHEQLKLPSISPEVTACKSLLPDYKGHCISSTSNNNLDQIQVLLIGDSHSEALAPGFIRGQPSVHTIALGKGGCLPFINVERFTESGPHGCPPVINPVIDMAEKGLFRQSTIVITARYALHVTGRGFGDIDHLPRPPGNMHIQAPGTRISKDLVNYGKVFEQGLRETLTILTKHSAHLIFMHQIPELGFDPRACLLRPLKLSPVNCSIKRAAVLERQAKYRAIAESVLRDFPGVKIFDPLDILCDAEFCYPLRDDKMLYRDDDHLSILGGEAISKALIRMIPIN